MNVPAAANLAAARRTPVAAHLALQAKTVLWTGLGSEREDGSR